MYCLAPIFGEAEDAVCIVWLLCFVMLKLLCVLSGSHLFVKLKVLCVLSGSHFFKLKMLCVLFGFQFL